MNEECIPFLAEVCKTEAVELKARPAERESSRPIEKAARRGPQFFFGHPTPQKSGMALSGGSQRLWWAMRCPTLPLCHTTDDHRG